MSPIAADLSILHECVRLSSNHPSSRLFRNDHLVGSTSGLLPKIDQHLAFSGIQTLLQARSTLKKGRDYLDSLLKHLASLENDTEDLLARCRALVAPVRCLPVELLQHIFELARLQDDQMDFDKGSPNAVAQVCSLWRNVALSMPSLWTTIVVCPTPKNVGKQLEHVSRRIGRTAGHLSSLLIEQSFPTRPNEVPRDESTSDDLWHAAGVEFARGLDPCKDHLMSLRVSHDSEEMVVGLFATLNASWTAHRMTNLQALSVEGFNGEHPRWEFIDSFIYRQAPNLERFSARGPSLGYIFDLRNTNVKVVQAKGWAWDILPDLWWLLPQSVEVLELGEFGDWRAFREPVTPVPGPSTRLQHLTSLSIVPIEVPFDVRAVDLLRLPSLRHLIFTQQCSLDFLPISVCNMLEAWGDQLDYLALITHDLDEYETTQEINWCMAIYLGFVPQVQALRLGSGKHYIEAVQNHSVSLPRLAHCEFDVGTLSTEDLDNLQAFAAHLKDKPHPSLRTIDVLYTDSRIHDIHSEILPVASKFAELGILLKTKERDRYEAYKFDGPYFERLGGIFDTLYSSD